MEFISVARLPEEPDGGDGGEDDEPARLGLQRPYNHLRSSAVYRVRVASGHPTPRHKIWLGPHGSLAQNGGALNLAGSC